MWTVNKQWFPSGDERTDEWIGRWMETYQVKAHVPVSRECTRDTERFLHFQER